MNDGIEGGGEGGSSDGEGGGAKGDPSFPWSMFTDVCMKKCAVIRLSWPCLYAPHAHKQCKVNSSDCASTTYPLGGPGGGSNESSFLHWQRSLTCKHTIHSYTTVLTSPRVPSIHNCSTAWWLKVLWEKVHTHPCEVVLAPTQPSFYIVYYI